MINPSSPDPRRREKINLNFIVTLVTLLCGTSKGFIKDLKAVIKPFKAPKKV